jgi:hypothetical protein
MVVGTATATSAASSTRKSGSREVRGAPGGSALGGSAPDDGATKYPGCASATWLTSARHLPS